MRSPIPLLTCPYVEQLGQRHWGNDHRCAPVQPRVSVCSHLSQGNGPLAEIEFWRERNATLSALYEQTKLPFVRKVFEVIKEAESMLTANVQPILTELFKLHMEASDNVRFLSTVERHFKVRRMGCSSAERVLAKHARSPGCQS